MSQFVLGLDIGYSNLKMAMGHKGEEARTVVMPVGAGPLELMPQQLTGGAGASIQVVIDGENGLQASSLTDCKVGSVSFTATILRPIHTRLFSTLHS